MFKSEDSGTPGLKP